MWRSQEESFLGSSVFLNASVLEIITSSFGQLATEFLKPGLVDIEMVEKFDTHKMTDHLYTCWGKSINYEDKLCKFPFNLLDIPFQSFVSTHKK